MKQSHIISSLFLTLLFLNPLISQELALLTNETTIRTSEIKNVQKVKKDTLYYDNGAIKEIKEIQYHALNGLWKYFYIHGQLKKEGAFKNNNMHGSWKTYDTEGTLIFVENYTNGIESGIWKAFYPNGKLEIEGTFIKGKRQGQWKVYQPSGVLEKIITFDNDQKKSELILKNNPKNSDQFISNPLLTNF